MWAYAAALGVCICFQLRCALAFVLQEIDRLLAPTVWCRCDYWGADFDRSGKKWFTPAERLLLGAHVWRSRTRSQEHVGFDGKYSQLICSPFKGLFVCRHGMLFFL